MADIFFDKGVWWTWGFIGEEGARVMFPVEIIPKEQVGGRVAAQFFAKSANEKNFHLNDENGAVFYRYEHWSKDL